ncbi:MAG: glycosyltransferase family A protein [Ilumatobacteraceae bacterium]
MQTDEQLDAATVRPADDVDVVMCTCNRAGSIVAAVSSILANDYSSFRLTIIDQSTTDATGVALQPIAEADARLRYVHVDEAGLSRAYNTGIRSTSAPTLAFTDDDCVVPVNWIQTIVNAFAAEPDGDLLYGQVVPLVIGDVDTPFVQITKPERLSRSDGFRVFGMGANFAARRRLFDRIGPFDEVLGGGGALKSSQDFDMTYRAYKGGSVVILRPEVTLRHNGRREPEDWPGLLRNYGIGDGAFYMKHVRCRDIRALRLLVARFGVGWAKAFAKLFIKRGSNQVPYLKGMAVGMRDSFRFKVDRQQRTYIESSGPQR